MRHGRFLVRIACHLRGGKGGGGGSTGGAVREEAALRHRPRRGAERAERAERAEHAEGAGVWSAQRERERLGAGPHRPHRCRRCVYLLGLQVPRRRLRCGYLLRGYRGGGAARGGGGGGGGGGVGGRAEQRERAMVLHLTAVVARGEDRDEVAPRAVGPVHACLHLLVRAHDEAEVLPSQEAARHARAEEAPDRAHVVGARALLLHGVVPQHLWRGGRGGHA